MLSLPLIGHIELTRGKVAIVDWVDLDWLQQFEWCCSEYGYAMRFGGIYMHVEIMRRHGIDPSGHDVDHRDGNPLNNSLSNLRLATRSQNCINAPKPRNNTSGYKGVTFSQRIGKWEARIGYKWDRKHLGYYSTAEEAAKAYNKAAVELFGEFAQLNVSQDGTELGILEDKYSSRAKQNKKLSPNKISIYKGVSPTALSKNKPVKKWLSQIYVQGKQRYLGTFETEEDAAYVYNQVSALLHGQNAVINTLPEDYEPSEELQQIHCPLPEI